MANNAVYGNDGDLISSQGRHCLELAGSKVILREAYTIVTAEVLGLVCAALRTSGHISGAYDGINAMTAALQQATLAQWASASSTYWPARLVGIPNYSSSV